MKKSILLILLLSIFGYAELFAQCSLFEIPLNQRIEQATHIIEGKIIAKRSFWDDSHSNIFTANKIEIYKSFDGSLVTDHVEILTRGGFVGLEGQTDHPSLQFKAGDTGIFFLSKNRENIASNQVSGLDIFQPETGPQGFVRYDMENGTAKDPFHVYEQIATDLYEVIEKALQKKYIKVNDFDLPDSSKKPGQTKVLAFTFSPTSVTAGTDMILTISDPGDGLGSQGDVEFSNADNGGATIDIQALDAEICSWTTSEITVQVPARACTGNFEVLPSGGGTITSSMPLTVTYAQLNAVSDASDPNFDSYQTQHVDRNANGGYIWQQHTDFASSSGATPFLTSMETWCNNTNIYWELGANTTVDVVANDNINIVRFDNGSELPGGVLGRCTNRWSGCFNANSKDCTNGTAPLDWWVEELDIAFDDGTNWYYSAGLPVPGGFFDFQSVAVHELGHAHQLGHVNDGSAVMHYAISSGSDKRVLNANEIAGATDVYNRSTTSTVCSQGLMSTAVDCSSLGLPVELLSFNVQKNASSVELNWRTATEINNDYFALERSSDGRLFTRLGTVSGAGNSQKEIDYSFTDQAPTTGTNYYRLKQVDFDGNYTFSDVRSVEFDLDKEQILIYPNPLNGSLLNVSFSASSEYESDLMVEIIDVKGTQLFQQQSFLEKGIHNLQYSLAEFPAGVYWLRFNWGANTHVEKVVKF